MQLFTAPDSDWRWNVGIADPRRPGQVIATLEVRNGAVATSGSAERGSHIIDPRTGEPARGVVSASVVDDSLARADLWATAAVVAGFDDRSWVARSGTRTGIVIADDGRVTRWLEGISVDVVAAGTDAGLSSAGDRQTQQERRAGLRGALDRHAATRAHRDIPHERQPEPEAAASTTLGQSARSARRPRRGRCRGCRIRGR